MTQCLRFDGMEGRSSSREIPKYLESGSLSRSLLLSDFHELGRCVFGLRDNDFSAKMSSIIIEIHFSAAGFYL